MKHLYHYFVAYTFVNGDGVRMFGRIEVPMKSKITKISQIDTIETQIEKIFPLIPHNFIITNFELLRRSRAS